MFLITHRPGIVAVADRVLVLRNGVVKADGPRDECWRRFARRNPCLRVQALCALRPRNVHACCACLLYGYLFLSGTDMVKSLLSLDKKTGLTPVEIEFNRYR